MSLNHAIIHDDYPSIEPANKGFETGQSTHEISKISPQQLVDQLAETPVIDVRSPSEFRAARIPGAINLPLLSDTERHEIGILYKQQGKHAAMERAYEMVDPRRNLLVEKAKKIARGRPCIVHCWRGGLRSRSVAALLIENGLNITLLEKGYKAFRKWAMSTLSQKYDLKVLGGMTGCGKTEILDSLKAFDQQVIDLEGIANHKGSAFGSLGQAPQPTQVNFENQLAVQLNDLDRNRPIWVEDESRHLGGCAIPAAFWFAMRQATVYAINRPAENRIDRLEMDYGQHAPDLLIEGVNRIRKRFGYDRSKLAIELIRSGKIKAAIEHIIVYYDKGYRKGISKRSVPSHILTLDVGNASSDAAAKKILSLAISSTENQAMDGKK